MTYGDLSIIPVYPNSVTLDDSRYPTDDTLTLGKIPELAAHMVFTTSPFDTNKPPTSWTQQRHQVWMWIRSHC